MSSQLYQQYPSSLNPAFQNQTQQRQSRPSIDKFKYNSTTLYKNNLPINFDIDSICEDLYNCANNKSLFNEIMKKKFFLQKLRKKNPLKQLFLIRIHRYQIIISKVLILLKKIKELHLEIQYQKVN